MNSWKGRIGCSKQFHVICGNCGYMDTDADPFGGLTRKQFERQLRKEGWRIRGGKWLCERCIEEDEQDG
jgi:hypothetical protein